MGGCMARHKEITMTQNMPAPEAGFDEFDKWARRNLPLWNHTTGVCVVNGYDETRRLQYLACAMARLGVDLEARLTKILGEV
jgi:hypothetical protein